MPRKVLPFHDTHIEASKQALEAKDTTEWAFNDSPALRQ